MTQTIDQRARELLAKHASETGCEGFTGLVTVPLALAALSEALTRIEELEGALTPSADTKADYIGEFKFQLQRSGYDDDGEHIEWSETVFVPWDTTKEIMAKILSRSTLTQGIKE